MIQSLPSSAWTPVQAAHLLNRAGFGGTPVEIEALRELGLEGAVERLLTGEEDDDLFPPPGLSEPTELHDEMATMRGASDENEKKELRQQQRKEQNSQVDALRAWWLSRMRSSPYPLREKLTLFWHGHFATGYQKVNVAYLMWVQNETLRSNALGDFRALSKQISRDPAMMRYLDTIRSGAKKPNENFARELMELFLLGEGVRYTEDDIKESARAFTGYRMDPRKLTFRRAERQADRGEKSFLGRQGEFDGDAIIDIVTEQPECAEFIVGKLWRFFAAEEAPPGFLVALGAHFRRSGFSIRSTLREMFLSEAFYAPSVIRSQIKSPVQWIVQTARVLAAPLPPAAAMDTSLKQMGQVLFEPPNVKGWPGGRAWITSSTYLFRCNLAGYVVSGQGSDLPGFRKNFGSVEIPLFEIAPSTLRADPEALYEAITMRMLNARLPEADRGKLIAFLRDHGDPVADGTVRDFLHLVMSTPEYQIT